MVISSHHRQSRLSWQAADGGVIGSVIGGVLLIGLGVLLVVIGAIGIAVSQGITRFSNVGETRMPGSVTFQAEDGARYGVALDDLRGTEDFAVNVARCTLTQPDGSRATLRGDVTAVSIGAGGLTRFGGFDGMDGTTTLDCRYEGDVRDDTIQLIVFRIRSWLQVTLYTCIGGGVALILLGVLLIVRSQRRRSQPTPPAGWT